MKKLLLLSLWITMPFCLLAQVNVDYSTPTEYEIGGINVVGAQFLDRNSLISIAGFKVGEKIKIPGDDISLAIRKLWKQGILGDIKISVTEIQGNKAFLQIELKERPRFSRIMFEGVPKGQRQTLEDKIKLIRGRVVTDALVKNTTNTLKNHYIEKGFKNVDVTIVPQKDTVLSNSVILKVIIDKKSKVKINEIKFEGIAAFEEKKLKKKMKKTKEKKFLRIFSPSKFIPEEYENDKQKLIDFYNQNGYRNMAIVEDTVYDHDEKTVNIDLKIEEGEKFFYRNIDWTGNYKYTDDQLSMVLGIDRGDVYNPKELNERLNFNPQGTDVTSLYMDDGYLFFSVEPVEVLVEGDSIDIEMRMFEGEQATINKVIVNGNTQTNDHVIFRELRTLPGQKFSRSDLIRTQRELATLGYFDPETIEINPKPNYANSTVDIEYNVTEKPNDQIELSGGWGGQFGFVGTLGLVFNNFSLRRITDFDYWKPLPKGDGQRLNLRMQANGRRYQTYSVTFTEPWLGGRKPNSFTMSFNRSVIRLISYTGDSYGSLKSSGVTVSLGRRLPWPDDFFTMSNSLSFLVYNLDDYNATGFENYSSGTSYNFTFNTTLARNSIDQPTFPRTGSSISLSASFTPPYSQFTGSSFAEVSGVEQYKWVEYHKWMFDNSWFLNIVGNLVLNTRVNMGFMGRYSKSKALGPFERFILGGDGLSQNSYLIGTDIIGLRGYQNNSIYPTNTDEYGGVIYNKFVMELRYPVSLNPSATIYVQTFVEGGNNWGSFEEYNPFNLYRSAGVGARIFMPAFGLLGVDWGYGFDEIPNNPDANGAQFHFTIGQQFR
ncbi:outer membrane protein assembly factor BamA [Chondrinema litorale]|uniref:outer membrane protein assembly factor BamA n=1 Tax=Chondrinema litorale TaxID=2994555 RepID=UPI0025438E31|nr:outer membrane protein assembly factor BamA [Chondrinema litorale]UZR93515.1 outer membrane protein assembly factor BamA [Chondrinema litorale]